MGLHKLVPKEVREHEHRVGVLAKLTARECGKDERAAYLAGVFHDDGKALLPPELFSGRDITTEEYELIKHHAIQGFTTLKGHMKFSGLCAGLHHRMGVDEGYGVTLEDIPKDFSFVHLKKLLDIATIVALADFIDAYSTRTTSLRMGSVRKPLDELLHLKYPEERVLIGIMLNISKHLYTRRSAMSKIVKIVAVKAVGCKLGCKCGKPANWGVRISAK